jgi:hypothetical protein
MSGKIAVYSLSGSYKAPVIRKTILPKLDVSNSITGNIDKSKRIVFPDTPFSPGLDHRSHCA